MNPYQTLGKKSFWRSAVADVSMFQIDNLWEPKFRITPNDRVVTFGSCFAQNIGQALKARGFNWTITEPPPYGMTAATERAFNYNLFSCRTGNIYTASLLRQWTSWALGETSAPEESWEAAGRYYDPFRPAVEPNGFESPDELRQSREVAIRAFARCINEADYFVFTLGLTESWSHLKGQYEYPMCPGTVAGEFDPTQHAFVNQSFAVVRENLAAAIRMMKTANPKLKFILTVSPVPLTATNSRQHVLVATTYSKSVLRAVAGVMAETSPYVDYFPSYEIVNAPPFKGVFFDPNQRTVTSFGVSFVMDHFFSSLSRKFGKAAMRPAPTKANPEANTLNAAAVCEEEMLAAFGTPR